MKEIKAFVRSIKASKVCKALRTNNYCCMTLTECEGTGIYTDPGEDFPTFKFPFIHSKIVKIEIVCTDSDVPAIVKIVQENGRTGYPGDGIIYVLEVEQVHRVKNHEKGVAALG